jgi:hypothetical protein
MSLNLRGPSERKAHKYACIRRFGAGAATFTLKRKPVLSFVIGLVVLLLCVLSYLWLSSTPPAARYLGLYDLGSIVTYWGSYFVDGFCAARLCRFIVFRRP